MLLVLVAFAIALVNLDSQTSGTAKTQSTASKQAATIAPASTTPKPQSAAVSDWPTGVSGWTVQLAQRRYRYKAFVAARRIIRHGIRAGVLNSSDHPSMRRGYWIVFSGRYPDQAAAHDAALNLHTRGYPLAHAVRVAPPGGI